MVSAADELVQTAHSAVAAGDFVTARAAFESMVELDPTPQALAGLGDTLWWLGRTDEAVRCQERAYAGFRRCGDVAQSAFMAIGLYLGYRVSLGNVAAARGWLGRAARLVEAGRLAPLVGWVMLLRAHDTADPAAAERWSREALAAASVDDPDLELCAISQLGASLLQQGRTEEGAALLDEAMAAALAGECRRPHTVVYTGCTLISACAETAEVDHAVQWIRAADGFTGRYASPHLYLHCRIYYGVILFASGDWAGAERELRAAMAGGASVEPALHAEAAARFAELRLAQGRLEEAERLLEGLEEHVTSAYTLAMLALAKGEREAARRIAIRRVREIDGQDGDRPGSHRAGLAVCLEAGRLWEVLANASPEQDAEAAVARLTELAEQTRCPQLQARRLRAAGTLQHDVSCLEQALSRFNRLHLPLEAAGTRMALADLLDGPDGVAEARSALAGFEALGAAHDADRAAARLRELGVTATRGGPSGLGELTRREHEVLDLLGKGLSNRELADRLFLSRKTVERHVRNVLFKLGLRNRAEAAAYVVRHQEEMRSTL